MSSPKKGFTVVEIVVVVVVLAIAGLIAWKVWSTMNAPKAVAPLAPVSEEIKTTEDLNKADKALDDTNVEGDETSQLDAEVNF